MTSETLPAQPAGRRGYVRYSRPVVREILMRVTNGESVKAICRDPWMPTHGTVGKWARERKVFRGWLNAARRLAGCYGAHGNKSRFCPATAQDIYLRLAAGETMAAICSGPDMPAETTVARWRRLEPEFDEALKVAREIQAERFADASLGLAEAATPETAYLTEVRLQHIRWLTGLFGGGRSPA